MISSRSISGPRTATAAFLLRAAPGHGIAGEVDEPFRCRLRRGVGGVEVQGATGTEQHAPLGVELEHLRQRAQLHPLVEGVKGDVGVDGELRAEGQGRVGPVDGRVRQLRGALGESGAEHIGVLVGVAGEVAELFIGGWLRRPGPYDRLDPAVAAEMPQQLTEVPARA